MSDRIGMGIGKVSVVTTTNGGLPPEHYAQRVVDRLMFIADEAPEPIRAQAHAFRDRMHAVILQGIMLAIESDRIYRK